MNNHSQTHNARITLMGRTYDIAFAPYEVKTLVITEDSLEEKEYWV
jgi:hypothetical protein